MINVFVVTGSLVGTYKNNIILIFYNIIIVHVYCLMYSILNVCTI